MTDELYGTAGKKSMPPFKRGKKLKKTIPVEAVGRQTLRYAPTPAPPLPPPSNPVRTPESTDRKGKDSVPVVHDEEDRSATPTRPKLWQRYSTGGSVEEWRESNNRTPVPPVPPTTTTPKVVGDSDSSSPSSSSHRIDSSTSLSSVTTNSVLQKSQTSLGVGRPTPESFNHSRSASQDDDEFYSPPPSISTTQRVPRDVSIDSFPGPHHPDAGSEASDEPEPYEPPSMPVRRYVYGEPLSTTFEETKLEIYPCSPLLHTPPTQNLVSPSLPPLTDLALQPRQHLPPYHRLQTSNHPQDCRGRTALRT
ncbi:hypothetical protein BT69DRAFT_318049 [Atractiella rhizophila]|nr:hypothetical protein BT69DRAFT_318049 [Atractiella rhizophila]